MDQTITRVAIYPPIGIARVGNSETDFLYGPESPDQGTLEAGQYKDANGAIKRQAARFRLYGYNAAGQVVREITASTAGDKKARRDRTTGRDQTTHIVWSAHLANQKSAWYRFNLALDIPDAARLAPEKLGLRNPAVTDRRSLINDPGRQTISGPSAQPVRFESGTVMGQPVYLGELRTDAAGRLLVLGGRGSSGTWDTSALHTFGNNDGWYDDTSDGPITAEVTIGGKDVPVDPAWVVVAPPDYAPAVKTVRTLHDLIYDVFVRNGQLRRPDVVSFPDHIEPILRRFCDLQWVNHGFAAQFGWRGPHHFMGPEMSERLADPGHTSSELRRQIYAAMRYRPRDGASPQPWPWIYGDGMAVPAASELQHMALSPTQDWMLQQWAAGEFDVKSQRTAYPDVDKAPVAEQPDLLTRGALDSALADAFHPGCEVTWPIRHDTMYMAPFRIRHRADSEPDYGPRLTPDRALSAYGPLYGQVPGGLTRWMAVPWQTDTASCRSGYEHTKGLGPRYTPYLPTFWPARVPNHVLTEEDFAIVNDTGKPDRDSAFERRGVWIRGLSANYPEALKQMVDHWYALGIVEARPYTGGDGKFPDTVLVESRPGSPFDKAPLNRNLINLHVPEAAGSSAPGDVLGKAIDAVARKYGFAKESIAAAYYEKLEPHREEQ
ncbi:hypothetical protein FCH28_00285 [Streptomyces piniterrae]|uniref:L-lysine 6-oxidase n=1 Tax=Streptomyces piniterrae TaxID=2571125 RepID=A0A4U0NVD0_9ACTN|nr:LodA/GoxA family CTQ-dependent oxidase [Streptomyces piniterrae]TJZ58665.1 hypothetical protein FCH28_00285 [Streptomyces piniterrae]